MDAVDEYSAGIFVASDGLEGQHVDSVGDADKRFIIEKCAYEKRSSNDCEKCSTEESF